MNNSNLDTFSMFRQCEELDPELFSESEAMLEYEDVTDA